MNFIDIDLINNICSDEYVVGYQGESYVSGIRFILPDELADWNAFIDLETANGDKTRYEIVDKDNNIITYEFTAVDLKYRGKLTLNLVLVKDRQILKPYVGEFIVKEAICAENESPENVPIILSSNLSNEIYKNIESRHEHSNIDVLNKLEESNNGNLIYNGNPIIDGSVSEECDPTVPEWAKQEEKPAYSADEISGFDEKSKELIDNSLQEAKESGLFDTELPSVTEADNGKVLRVVDGVWGTDEIPDASGIDDVQINGTTIVTDGIAEIPIAKKDEEFGIIKTSKYNGITVNSGGHLVLLKATNSEIDSRYPYCGAIAPYNLDYSVKAAMCDGKGTAWTTEEQAAAKDRMGINNWDTILSEVALDTETAKYILCSCDEYDRIEIIIKRELNNTSLTGNMFFEIVDSNGNSVVELYANSNPGYRERLIIMEVNSGYAHCIMMHSNNLYASSASMSRGYYVGNGCKYCLKIPKPNTSCDGLSTMTVIGRRR